MGYPGIEPVDLRMVRATSVGSSRRWLELVRRVLVGAPVVLLTEVGWGTQESNPAGSLGTTDLRSAPAPYRSRTPKTLRALLAPAGSSSRMQLRASNNKKSHLFPGGSATRVLRTPTSREPFLPHRRPVQDRRRNDDRLHRRTCPHWSTDWRWPLRIDCYG